MRAGLVLVGGVVGHGWMTWMASRAVVQSLWWPDVPVHAVRIRKLRRQSVPCKSTTRHYAPDFPQSIVTFSGDKPMNAPSPLNPPLSKTTSICRATPLSRTRTHLGHGRPTTPCARRPRPTSKVSGPAWRAKLLSWNKPFTKVLDESNAPFYKWFEDGDAERLLQLPGPQHGARPGRQDRHHLRSRRRRSDQASPTANCWPRPASSPTRSRPLGVGKGRPRRHLHAHDASKAWSPCRPAPASAPPTAWCSAASRPRRCKTASTTPAPWP